MNALLKSWARTAAKVAGTALATGAVAAAVSKGHIDQPTANVLTAALNAGDWSTVMEALAGVAVTGVAAYLSHVTHKVKA